MTAKKKLNQCISRKISAMKNEDKPQKQKVAIAYSKCRKKRRS